jgi:hypothetical protein
VIVEIAVCPLAVQVGQRRVVRTWAGDHHVSDRCRQVGEEPLEGLRIGGVEGCRSRRAEFGRGMLKGPAVKAGQHDFGTLGACVACRFKPDARASADHDDGLSQQRRCASGGISYRGGHRSSWA